MDEMGTKLDVLILRLPEWGEASSSDVVTNEIILPAPKKAKRPQKSKKGTPGRPTKKRPKISISRVRATKRLEEPAKVAPKKGSKGKPKGR